MRVICTLPHNLTVAEAMGGAVYVPIEVKKDHVVRVSEEMPDAAATRLLTIPGYGPYRGDEAMTKAVDKAVEEFRFNHAASIMAPTDAKDRTIKELQENLRLTQREMDEVRLRNIELEEENAAFKKDLGEPSLKWTRKQLEDKAVDVGIPVGSGMKKEEILQALEEHEALKG